MDIPEISVDELEKQLAAGAILFDVREDHEYANAHIDGARLIPLATVPDNIEAFRTGHEVYVICAKGIRSASAVGFLRQHGVEAINVAGGMGAWLGSAKQALSLNEQN